MRLYDNDAYREEFMALVYALLQDAGTNDLANQIIDAFDMAPEVAAEPLPPNDPLTLEQLREMDGEAVWICDPDGSMGMFALVDVRNMVCRTPRGGWAIFENFGQAWLAYRRKPEKGQ